MAAAALEQVQLPEAAKSLVERYLGGLCCGARDGKARKGR
jgi:hypothetical protein